jgi:hypothetical protein
MYVDEGEKMKKILLNRQLKKVTLKFWNNMIILSVLMLLLVGSVSAVDTVFSDQESIGNTNDTFYNDVQASLTKESAVKAYNVMSLMEPNALIKSVNSLSLVSDIVYEIESTYTLTTINGEITVSVTSQVNGETGRITVLDKKVVQSGEEFTEKEDELWVVSNGKLTVLSVTNKENAQKMLVNAVELLVEEDTIQRPTLSSQKEFVVMIDGIPDFATERELISTEKYKFYVVKTGDLSELTLKSSVIKICEAKQILLKKFVEYSKEVLSAESEEKIRELKFKKTTEDCLELPQLKDYMQEDGWDALPGQTSAYQQFVTPDEEKIQDLSDGKTVQEIYEMAVDWTWVSDSVLFDGKQEKWLLPVEFLTNTPGYSTNPSSGNIVSDCSEQANTLVSLLRASGVAAEDVRVVLGKVDFDGSIGGHAWVEIKEDGRWMVIDATCGSYYDEESDELVSRDGVNYGYWKYHTYPEVEVWCYYNDVYFTDEKAEVADGWSNQYDVFTEADMFAGFLFEESFDVIFVYVVIAAVAVISFISLGKMKQKGSGKK